MRNKYKGICYYCGKTVEVGDGHFERHEGGWGNVAEIKGKESKWDID